MTPYVIRQATVADAAAIAVHRAAMFADMGRIHDDATRATLIAETHEFLQRAMPAEEYLAWLAVDVNKPTSIVGGAGVHRRQTMPFPKRSSYGAMLNIAGSAAPTGVAQGRQAIVMNVYTHPSWRRLGVARELMETIIAWARACPLDSLVLHASSEGRALYESLGFVGTNEMGMIP